VIFVDDGLCSRRKDSNYDMIMRRGWFFLGDDEVFVLLPPPPKIFSAPNHFT